MLNRIVGSNPVQAFTLRLRKLDGPEVLRMVRWVTERAHVRGVRERALLYMTLIVRTLRYDNTASRSLFFTCLALRLHSDRPAHLIGDGFRIAPFRLERLAQEAAARDPLQR